MNDLADNGPERVQKVLARLGYGSRRVCEEIILARRVKVNGTVAVLGDRVTPERDRLEVDGQVVSTKANLVYYLLNKPRGVISTSSDPHGRTTVVELVPKEPRVFPVGRLDGDSEGLLIMTNDGEIAFQLTHPSHGVEKEYLVHLRRPPTDSELSKLKRGVILDDGPTLPTRISRLDLQVVRMTLHEGKNRQIRRMYESVSNEVVRLVRIRIGPITDRTLKPGEYRELSPKEVIQLRNASSANVRSRPQTGR